MGFWPKKTGRWPGFGETVHWRVLTVKMQVAVSCGRPAIVVTAGSIFTVVVYSLV